MRQRYLVAISVFGIYNVHTGFDPLYIDQVSQTLKEHGIETNADELLTLEGFCRLRRELDNQPNQFLDSRIRRFQNFAEIKTEPGPHFGFRPGSMRHGHHRSVNTVIF